MAFLSFELFGGVNFRTFWLVEISIARVFSTILEIVKKKTFANFEVAFLNRFKLSKHEHIKRKYEEQR